MGGCLGGSCSGSSTDEVRRKRPSNNTRADVNGRLYSAPSVPVYRSTNDNTPVSKSNHVHKVDLNLAQISELATLPDINLYRAQAIVNYRNQHGPFKKVNDVSNVPGISPKIMNKIINRVYLSHNSNSSSNRDKSNNINGYMPKANSNSLRIAAWNLKCFGVNRASEKNVLEVVCLTILKSRIDLIALQELADPDVLKMICKELNAPKIQSVKQLNSRLHWSYSISEKTGRMYQSSEYNGFLWSNDHSLQFTTSGILGGKKHSGFVRRPFIGHYQIGRLKLTLVSVHLKATGLDGSAIAQLKEEIRHLPTLMDALRDQGHANIILLGDFNMDSNDESFHDLRNHGYQNLIPSHIPTNISARNFRGGHQYDNIWVLKRGLLQRHNRVYGVVREGLITNDSEVISDHCPVWADINL